MDFNTTTYIALVLAGAVGGICVLPYALELNKDRLAELPMPLPKLLVLSMVQTLVMLLVLTALGLLAANEVGLSVSSPAEGFPVAIVLGIIGCSLLLLLETKVFHPRMPEAMKQASKRATPWKGFLASFYGAITEEVLSRLFLMSGIVWLLGNIWEAGSGAPAEGAYWVAIGLAALIFGLLHLPATIAITPLTPLIFVRAIVLNGIGGLVFGWLFWEYGLTAAMVSHFTFDIMLHVIAPALHLFEEPEAAGPLQPTPQQ